MCLAIPGKIKNIEGSTAFFDFENYEHRADISFISEPQIGDWILMHDGRAMSKIDEAEAKENLHFIQEHEKNHQSKDSNCLNIY